MFYFELTCVMIMSYCFRIIDNMPVTWCYDVEGGQKYCSPGFPMGCYVDPKGKQKDACVTNVSYGFSLVDFPLIKGP